MNLTRFIIFTVLLIAATSIGFGQTTEFTYQGRLLDGTIAANASYDFTFGLYDAETGGTLLGTLSRPGVFVSNGIFTVKLDFGVQFAGAPHWLDISVKLVGAPNPATLLTPRQPITSAPYAMRSTAAENSDLLGGIPSAGFIQDGTSPQAADFNISGNGAVGGNLTVGGTFSAPTLNAGTHFEIGGQRVIYNAGIGNFFAGSGTGMINTGSNNSFFGSAAGLNNTTGASNSFFGSGAGQFDQTGGRNSLFGFNAGRNITGGNNTLFGAEAGLNIGLGFFNTAVGERAGKGVVSSTASNNTFVGRDSGRDNSGNANTFLGVSAGALNQGGFNNTFVGIQAGDGNLSGDSNTLIGAGADVTANNLSFATAIGAGAVVTSNNTIVLGRNTGEDDVFTFGDLSASSLDTRSGNITSGANTILRASATNNFLGVNAGATNGGGTNNTAIGTNADFNAANRSFTTVVGAGAIGSLDNSVYLGRGADTVRIPGTLRVTSAATIFGRLTIGTFGLGGDPATFLCLNPQSEVSVCTSGAFAPNKQLQAELNKQKVETDSLKAQVLALRALICGIKQDAAPCKEAIK